MAIDMSSPTTRVLYVEDELSLATIVQESLQIRGYEVTLVADGAEAVTVYEQGEYDICVLDIMLPHVSGYDIGRRIKELSPQMPIIYLTAKTQTQDVLAGFEAGGNDYLKKPFSMEELIVRIDNLCRLSQRSSTTVETTSFDLGSLTFYPQKQELLRGEDVQSLSHRESMLLETLCQHQNIKCDRRHILMTLWGDDSFYNSRNLDVYITRLRKYLRDSHAEIVTLKGVGYLFKVEG